MNQGGACLAGAVGAFAQQAAGVAVPGKGGEDGRQGFGDEDIPVAGVAEGAGQRLPGLAVGGDEVGRQDGREQLDRGAQAAQRDAGLVHVFRVGAGDQAALVALEMFETAEGDGAEGGNRRHLPVERGGLGLEWCFRQPGEQGVAALRLARHGGAQVERVLQFAGQAEDVGHVAADQLEFDLADRHPAPFALYAAAVDAHFDHGFAERHVPEGAPEIGGEYRLQLRRRVVEEYLDFGIVDVAEVEFPRVSGGFPFAAHGQPAAGRLGRFDGEQPLPALLAEAHGHPPRVQFQFRRVVIGVQQVLALCLDARQQRMRRQLPRHLRGQLQLEFDFCCHG